ncbi:MAG TPA: SIMPL domain-containing protein [Ignavibacteria bacterium]|jgi:hypothetical protein
MEESGNKKAYLSFAIVLAIGFIIGAFIISSTWKGVSRNNVTISVTGSASKQIKSDLAVWSGHISVQSKEMVDGYTKLQESIKKVKDYLISKGFPGESIKFTSVNTSDAFEGDEGGYLGKSTKKKVGVNLSQEVTVESSDVDKVDLLSRQVTELIMQGVGITSESPQFYYTKLSDLKIEMIGLASEDAKLRADQIAKSTGNKVGEVRSSKTGVMQINAKNSTEVSDYGVNDTSSLEKTITAVVSVTFSIQ